MPLKKCILIRIIKCAASIRKNLGFEYYEIKTLYILDDSDKNNVKGNEVDDSDNNKKAGEGDYNYDIDNVLLGIGNGNNNDDNYDNNKE
ncbi:hypothetical protein RhiirB3_454058 [Rhizophagus irregularis]|nr:hypothetical protein RhiirB3_454058 [Rhizophagus irregularis]